MWCNDKSTYSYLMLIYTYQFATCGPQPITLKPYSFPSPASTDSASSVAVAGATAANVAGVSGAPSVVAAGVTGATGAPAGAICCSADKIAFICAAPFSSTRLSVNCRGLRFRV